jgi:hypothetical protein
MKLVLPLMVMTASLANPAEQAPHLDRIAVVDYGIYTGDAATSTPAPGTSTGQVTFISNLQLAEATRTIPARLGVRFGFRFDVIGEPEGKTVTLHAVTIFPPPGLKNPALPQPKARSDYNLTATLGTQSYRTYTFDSDWEVVPGVWTMQLWDADRMVAEERFTVVRR